MTQLLAEVESWELIGECGNMIAAHMQPLNTCLIEIIQKSLSFFQSISPEKKFKLVSISANFGQNSPISNIQNVKCTFFFLKTKSAWIFVAIGEN